MSRVAGIEAAVIADRDGVVVLKGDQSSARCDSDSNSDFATVTKDMVPDLTLRPGFLATAATTADQASKLGIGRSRTSIAEYETHQVVHFHKNSFVVSVVASKTANTGLILSLEHLFDPVIDELQRVIRPE